MSNQGEIFERALSSCTDCKTLPLSSTLEKWNLQKPCVQYRTHIEWKREHVKVLYVAESPPGTSQGYFYEPKPMAGYKEILRTEVFRLLKIEGDDVAQRLEEFKKREYFLSDAVKCRCYKGWRSQVPTSLAKNCGMNWLGHELDILKPERICTLGEAALKALSTVAGYEALTGVTAGNDCGTTVKNTAKPVLVWVFPSDRTSRYSRDNEDRFLKFAQGKLTDQ